MDQINHTMTEMRAESVAQSACYLSAHAYCCEFDDGAIILDLRGDTYLGIDAHHLVNLRTRIRNWPVTADGEAGRPNFPASEGLIADLLSRGILTTSPTSGRLAATNPIMALGAPTYAEARRRIRFIHVAQFSIAFLTVTLRLKRHGLAFVVERLRRRQAAIRRENTVTREDVIERLASFMWLRTWCYTARRRCLFDSLVLSVYLTKGMVPCTFVIGVATKPFLAHSWVQMGEAVLNDTAEHTHDFMPILNIGGG